MTPEQIAQAQLLTLQQRETLAFSLTNIIGHCPELGPMGKGTISALIDYIVPFITSANESGFINTPDLALPNPVEKENGYGFIAGPNTYTQAGGPNIVVTEILNLIYWESGVWSFGRSFPIPLPQNKINGWVAGAYAAGSQVNYQNVIWEANAITVSGDVPGVSSKWVNKLIPANDLVTNNTNRALAASVGVLIKQMFDSISTPGYDFVKRTENMSIADSAIMYQSSTFSGFGWINPAVQDFNCIRLRLRSWDATTPVTQIRIVIRETNSAGAILIDNTIAHSFASTSEEIVTFILSATIANAGNIPLWISYITNGNVSMRGNSGFTGATLKYKTDKILANEPATNASSPNAVAFVEFFTATAIIEPSDSFSDAMYVKMDEDHGISGGALAKEALIKKYTLAEFKYSTGISGSWGHESSIFTGQGQVLPAVQNFNGVRFGLRYWNVANPITAVRVVVRKNDRFGTIITNQVLPFTAGHLVEQELVAVFDNYVNADLSNIWVEYTANNLCGIKLGNSDAVIGATARYRTNANPGTTFADASQDDSGNSVTYFELGVFENKVIMQDEFVQTAKEQLGIVDVNSNVNLFLPSQIFIAEGLQHNIFFKNAVVPDYGDNLSNYRVDLTGAKGFHYMRGHRFVPGAGDVGSSNLTMSVYKGRTQILTKVTTLNVAALASGTGVTRKVLIVGDSTVDGSDINTPLKAYFDADAMDVVFVGTRGAAGVKHEGFSGWTINDFATFGRTLFRFNVVSIPAQPSINDEYTNNGSTFKVVEINITSGTGYFSCERIAGSNSPILTTSTLTRTAGSGAATINYATAEVESANPFWNAGTSQFDLGMYLTNTGQTMSAGDWVFFQLGINDQFGQTTISNADAKSLTMWAQLKNIMDQIQIYNPDIRIGIIGTIPPATTQDSFGFNYQNGQNRDLYFSTGWASWHRKLQLEMDNAPTRALKRYLVGAHLNLDTDYNFPKTVYKVNSRNLVDEVSMQTNGVHPDTTGNAQISDVYAGIIKYYA